jgi:hypothetical protein
MRGQPGVGIEGLGRRHARESEGMDALAARVPSEVEARRAGAERPPWAFIPALRAGAGEGT